MKSIIWQDPGWGNADYIIFQIQMNRDKSVDDKTLSLKIGVEFRSDC